MRPLRISVITSPQAGVHGPVLQRDIELVRATLLYADEVELISPGAAMLGAVAQLADGGVNGILDLLLALDDDALSSMLERPLPEGFREMAKLLPLALDPGFAEFAGLSDQSRELTSQLQPILDQFSDVVEGMVKSAGADELIPALDQGIVTLHDAGMGASNTLAQVSEFSSIILNRLKDPRCRVLFDSQTASLASALIEVDGDGARMGLRRAGQAAVGSGLISRLPAFPSAPIDELLDLRNDLTTPLIRYRAATTRFASSLSPGALGEELEAQIDDLWMAEVQPALLEVHEQLADHRLVRELARHAAQDLRTFLIGGAGVYMGLTTATSLGEASSALVSGGLGAAAATARSAMSASDGKRDARRHELFFLYEADRRLSG